MKKTLALILLLAGLTLDAQAETLTWNGEKSYDWNSWDANWLDEDGKAAVFKDGDTCVPIVFWKGRDWCAMIGGNEGGWSAFVGVYPPRRGRGCVSCHARGDTPQVDAWGSRLR